MFWAPSCLPTPTWTEQIPIKRRTLLFTTAMYTAASLRPWASLPPHDLIVMFSSYDGSHAQNLYIMLTKNIKLWTVHPKDFYWVGVLIMMMMMVVIKISNIFQLVSETKVLPSDSTLGSSCPVGEETTAIKIEMLRRRTGLQWWFNPRARVEPRHGSYVNKGPYKCVQNSSCTPAPNERPANSKQRKVSFIYLL